MTTNQLTDKNWLADHLKKIKDKAGPRYSAELNVDLPIAQIFDGLGRTNEFYISVRSHFGNLNRQFGRVRVTIDNKEIQGTYKAFKQEVIALSSLLMQIKGYDTQPIPWSKVRTKASRAIDICWQIMDQLREEKHKLEKEKTNNEEQNSAGRHVLQDIDTELHYLYESQKELKYFEELSNSTMGKLTNSPFLLITGIAGSGKTHLVCDHIKNRFYKDKPLPAILTFGEHFIDSKDIFQQIANQANIKQTGKQLLQSLNDTGKRSKSRALIIIDGLNETKTRTFWKKYLGQVIEEIKKYPNIGLVVCLRSGFEQDVLTKKVARSFVQEEHKGFQFREWEAINKFFHEFNLPLPEIPLLTPEFQNPLFLLLFCKAFQNRSIKGKNKQIFKGHEGATYIFEAFVDRVSKKILKQFGIINSKNNSIWDHIIEKIAEEMVNGNKESISEDQLNAIVEATYSSIDQHTFIQELERNLLIVKTPRYSAQKREYDGFDFRFPFQKFSDHLIGRYLFKKYEKEFGKANKNPQTAKKFFSKRRKLGQFLFRSWNRGVVEALSIQCPEHLKGTEFIEVAPYLRDNHMASEAFIESLVWRKPDAFSQDRKNTLDYINSKVIRSKSSHDNLINAFLSVTPIPNHPFNADFLHQHLSKYSMADRDAWWSTFLHYQYGLRGAVDRLVEWGWSSQDKTHLDDESIRLCSVALAWFLTTPNRFLRDKSTKALVSILTGRPHIVQKILDQFRDVNDPYVVERLYAVAYGVALRSRKNKNGLKLLATWIYRNIFQDEKTPTNILLRDYARGVIHVALDEDIKFKLSRKKITPPFKSKWSGKIPSAKTLKKKYYPEDFFKDKTQERGFLNIWSSVMYDFGSLGDFGNYVLNTNVNHWSGRKLEGTDINRKKLLEKFKKGLTPSQRRLFGKATNPFWGINFSKFAASLDIKIYDGVLEDDRKLEVQAEKQVKVMINALQKFELSLSPYARSLFRKDIKPYLDDRGYIKDPLERFNTGLAQRWVFNRVVELGWKSNLHGEFDNLVNYSRGDRSDHKVERIGKKYQWIALHELLGLISDNFEFKEDSWSEETEKYNGTWQLSIRDIDPSCILKDTPSQPPNSLPTFVNYRINDFYNAWSKKSSHYSWLEKTNDVPNPTGIIETTDSEGNKWVALNGFIDWQESTPPEQQKYDVATRQLWYMIKSYLVKSENKSKMIRWMQKQNFMGRWMPESHEFYNVYLSEYPWSPAFLTQYTPYYGHDGWTDKVRGSEKMPSKILVTDDTYLSSGSSIDCSTDETITVKLPAKYIIDKMKLTQPYVDGRFFDSDNTMVAFDPSVFSSDISRFVFFRKNKLVEFLESRGYSIIWTLLGEKNIIGGSMFIPPEGWMEINGVYTLANNIIFGSLRASFSKDENPIK